MIIYTIGFTKKSAASFFESLKSEAIKQLVDVRLNNTSQLSGFSKRDDLKYFLKTICGIEYKHEPLLAPTQEMLDAYKKSNGAWIDYERQFLSLMTSRQVENRVTSEFFQQRTALLCSEEKAIHCHRRLIIDYLNSKWGDVEAKHL